MKSFFNRILLPVVFNAETKGNIARAIGLANDLGCDLHLLHVKTFPTFLQHIKNLANQNKKTDQHCEMEMLALVEQFRVHMADGLLLTSAVTTGDWQAGLKKAVITNYIDLVIIPRYDSKIVDLPGGYIDVNKLAQHTQCPVLTISNFNGFHWQNIVVPVNDFLPLRKLTAATFLAKKFDGMVHLLGQRSNTNTIDMNNTVYLTKAYQLLRNYTKVKVYRAMQKKGSVAEDTLDYARKVHADLIVVNPGKESLAGGWFRRWMENYFPSKTNIPVLTISAPPGLKDR
ncbi:MAG TPA: universal stress protein [Chitinophagaceae bacterium]